MESTEIQNNLNIEHKKERIKLWLKNYHNLLFLGILVFTIIIRLYYFFLTKNQPLWWDEADYMAYAKNLAGINNDWIITPQHNSLFPYLAAIFFKLGLSEAVIRFVLEVFPSILLVYVVYLTCATMYKDKRIALISSFLMAVFWENLFNSFRFHLETLGLLFGFLAIYCLFKGYEKKEKVFGLESKWALLLTAFLVVLTYSIRRGFFIFGLLIVVYILLTKNIFSLLKDKYVWFAGIFGVILFFLAENLIFTAGIAEIAPSYVVKEKFNLIPLQVFANYFCKEQVFTSYFCSGGGILTSFLFYLNFLGIILILFNLFLFLGHLRKEEHIEARSDLIAIFAIVFTLAHFLFIQKRTTDIGDPRWYYPLLLGSFIAISKGATFIGDFFKTYSKYLGVILILILIGYGGYYELQHADMIIKAKLPSFEGIRQAGLFIQSVSSEKDIVVGLPNSQSSYYSERKSIVPMKLVGTDSNVYTKFEDFIAALKKPENSNVRFIVVTFSEPGHPEWMRKEEIINGQYSKWEIPFMNTAIDFLNNKQDIKDSVSYGNIEFKLLKILEDAFVYEIVRKGN